VPLAIREISIALCVSWPHDHNGRRQTRAELDGQLPELLEQMARVPADVGNVARDGIDEVRWKDGPHQNEGYEKTQAEGAGVQLRFLLGNRREHVSRDISKVNNKVPLGVKSQDAQNRAKAQPRRSKERLNGTSSPARKKNVPAAQGKAPRPPRAARAIMINSPPAMASHKSLPLPPMVRSGKKNHRRMNRNVTRR
jgi:hypothetical protein